MRRSPPNDPSRALAAVVFVSAAVGVLAAPAWAVRTGKSAPEFVAKDSDGKAQRLASYRGKYVVLEWLNHGCPYVRKHYDSKNMQGLQDRLRKAGVVWLSVISSAPGKEGYASAAEANAALKKHGAKPTAVLLDPEGRVGRLYGAKTTPHMFIVDPQGKLIYQGAIDSIRSTDPDDIPKAKNYVAEALREAMAGKPVSQPTTAPYGCSVKYK